MTRKVILGMLGAAVLAGLPAALAARKTPPTFKGRPPGGIPVAYDFVATRPDYDTMRVTFRSACRSAGPLFVTGRNRKGSLTVKFPKAGALSVFSGDARLVEVMGGVETQGTFTAVATHYSADRTGAAGYVCGDWVRRDDQPAVRLDVASVTNWRGYEAPKEKGKAAKPRHTFTYRVTIKGALTIDRKTVPITADALAGFDPAASDDEEATLTLRANVTVEGPKFGLTGDDAGPLNIGLVIVGFTTFKQSAKDLVKTSDEAKKPKLKLDLDGRDGLGELEGLDE